MARWRASAWRSRTLPQSGTEHALHAHTRRHHTHVTSPHLPPRNALRDNRTAWCKRETLARPKQTTLSREAHVLLWSPMTISDSLYHPFVEWRVEQIGLNPRGFWTYLDEDLVGTILVEVSQSCPPSTLAPMSLTCGSSSHCAKSGWRPHDEKQQRDTHKQTADAQCSTDRTVSALKATVHPASVRVTQNAIKKHCG